MADTIEHPTEREDTGREATETLQLCSRIARSLVEGSRLAALYPAEHPRVGATLERLQEALRGHEELCGEPWRLDVTESLESSLAEGAPRDEAEGRAETEAEVELARRLDHHLVESLTIRSAAPLASLYRVFALLTQDPTREGTTVRDVLAAEPLEGVEVRLFEMADLPTSLDDLSKDPSGGEAGDGSGRLHRVLDELPESVRDAARRVLGTPGVQVRLLEVGARTRARMGSRSGETLDLTEEMVRAAATAALEEAGGEDLDRRLAARLHEVADLVEAHIGALVASGGDLGLVDLTGPRPDLRDASSVLADEAGCLQGAKRQLAALFRTAGSTPKPPSPPSERARSEKPTARSEPEMESTDPLAELGELSDLDALRREAERRPPLGEIVPIVFDLLDGSTQEAAPDIGDAIVKRLEATVSSEEALRDIAAKLASRARAGRSAQVDRLLVDWLDQRASPEECRTALDAMAPTGREPGPSDDPDDPDDPDDLLSTLVGALGERRGDDAIPFLVDLAREGGPEVARAATGRLVSACENRKSLARWVAADPGGFLKAGYPRLKRRLGTFGAARALARYFGSSDPGEAISTLDHLGRDEAGAEDFLVMAAAEGSAEVRAHALRRLGTHASPRAVAILIETVKRNNYRVVPDRQEVEGALAGLLESHSPRAGRYLESIRRRTGWLTFSHRREIRRALADLEAERDGSPEESTEAPR